MKPLKAASSNSDAMSNFQNPLSEGQQVVPLPGAEQTTSLLVVLIAEKLELSPDFRQLYLLDFARQLSQIYDIYPKFVIIIDSFKQL